MSIHLSGWLHPFDFFLLISGGDFDGDSVYSICASFSLTIFVSFVTTSLIWASCSSIDIAPVTMTCMAIE
ncbi:unnamed protein product [Prunus brigantina]